MPKLSQPRRESNPQHPPELHAPDPPNITHIAPILSTIIGPRQVIPPAIPNPQSPPPLLPPPFNASPPAHKTANYSTSNEHHSASASSAPPGPSAAQKPAGEPAGGYAVPA